MTIIARSTEPVLHRPDTLAEALALSGPGSVWWAGGTDLWLMIDRKGLRPEALIDLTHIAELQLIQTTEAETTLGAAVTLAELEESPLPAVAEAVRRMCTVQTRTLATLGGNLCHAAPSADLAPVLLALGAEVSIAGPKGARRIPLDGFFTGPGRTDLSTEEILTAVHIPTPRRQAAAYTRIARTVVDIALAGAAASLTLDEECHVVDARVALCAVAPVPLLVPGIAEALKDRAYDSLDFASCARMAEEACAPITDLRASADYRRRMAGVLTRRALTTAADHLRRMPCA